MATLLGGLFVVPLVGTWIEINPYVVMPVTKGVVPLVGTWIEMSREKINESTAPVVPLVGTWIEIKGVRYHNRNMVRRSPCGNVD